MPSSPAPSSASARTIGRSGPLQAGLLLAAILVAYANAFGGSFQFDDFNVIVRQPAVHSLAAWWDSMPGIRPLLKLSYALSWAAGGGSAIAFHAVNVALHAANVLLAWAVLRELWRRMGAGEAEMAAFAGALLFALHPAHTEAVSYVSGRSVSLMAFFYLASMLAYLRGAPRWVSLALFAAALATKEVAVTLPAALLLCDALDQRQPFDLRAALRRQWAHWALLVIGLAAMAMLPRYREMLETSLALRGLKEQLALQAAAIVRHAGVLSLAVAPNIDPEVPFAPTVAVLAILAAIGVGFALLRLQPWYALALLWFFLHLAPTNSILARADAVNDRQLYLASLGPLALAGLAIALMPRARSVALAAAAVLLTAATIARNRDDRSEAALWSDTVRKSPGSARAWNNLGYAYQLEGRREEARAAYQRALALDPEDFKAKINLQGL
jgi:tetratricopeptide (TPR) repeat protein